MYDVQKPCLVTDIIRRTLQTINLQLIEYLNNLSTYQGRSCIILECGFIVYIQMHLRRCFWL